MKTSIYYIFGALAVLASCAKEIEKTDEPVSTTARERVTIIAQTPQTKTTAEVNGDDVDFSWQANEKIAVIEQDAVLDSDEDLEGALFTISNQTDGYFTGTKTAGKDLVFAVSPAQALTEADMYDGTSYTIELPATYSNYVSGTTNAVMIGVPDGDPVENTYKFKFSHAAALIKYVYENVPVGTTGFKFTTDANITGSFSLSETSGVTLTTPTGTNKTSVTIMLPSAISSLNQTLVFYVPVPAGEYGLFRSVLLCGEKKNDSDNINNKNEIASTVRKKTLSTKVNLAKGDVFITPTITLDNTVDILTYAFTGLSTGNDGYTAWSGKNGTSGVVYAGSTNMNQGTVNHNYIQLRNDSGKKDAGIYTTTNSSGRIARKVCVTWATAQTTTTNRYITVYGKSTAYTSVTELYSSDTRGEELGTITKAANVSTASLTIADNKDYEFIGLLASQPLYCDEIDITWEAGKPEAGIVWKNSAGNVATSGEGSIIYGDETKTSGAPIFDNPNSIPTSEIEFSSTDEGVAKVSDDGVVTIKAAGETTIKAIFAGNSTYSSATVQYELEVKDNTPRSITAAYGTTPAHGSITFDPTSPTTVGTTITVNDEPEEDYVLTALVYNDGTEDHDILSSKSFTMPAANVTVTATFSPLYSITHTASNGTISISTADKVLAGTSVNITALTPESGFAQRGAYDVYKTGDTSTKVNVENNAFTMPAYNVTIAAVFDPLYTVSFSATHGSAEANPASALSGTTIEITAEPDEWYSFSGWSCSDVTFANASAATTTFSMPTKNVTVTASFAAIPHIVVDQTAISDVSKDGVTTTKANIYSWADGFGTGDAADVTIETTGENKGFDGTVVTAASLDGTTLSYTVDANTSGARSGWIKICFKGAVIGTIQVNQAAGVNSTVYTWTLPFSSTTKQQADDDSTTNCEIAPYTAAGNVNNVSWTNIEDKGSHCSPANHIRITVPITSSTTKVSLSGAVYGCSVSKGVFSYKARTTTLKYFTSKNTTTTDISSISSTTSGPADMSCSITLPDSYKGENGTFTFMLVGTGNIGLAADGITVTVE